MNLASTISLSCGGAGSGCRGENCGRPEGYHGTLSSNVKSILKHGIQPGYPPRVSLSLDKKIALGYADAKSFAEKLETGKKEQLLAVVVVKDPLSIGFKKQRGMSRHKEISREEKVHPRHIDRIEIYNPRNFSKPVKVLRP